MRNCPVCNSLKRTHLWTSNFVVPDGWSLPKYLDWMQCKCGMLYGDNETASQSDYNRFYTERYGYGVADAEAKKRLAQRALYISQRYLDKTIEIVDYGGGDSGLAEMLKKLGFENCITFGCGDTMPQFCDVVITEHVLEHVYDMNETMQNITHTLVNNGLLIVDVPDAAGIALNPKTPILDFVQVHINHFRTSDILRLMERWGFELLEISSYTERFGPCKMFVFIKHPNLIGELSKTQVQNGIAQRVKKLREMNQEVILWGCGDIALQTLAELPLNVKYFVDSNPAFRGATIQGKPVFEKPHTNHPIVVNCQTQKDGLINYIRDLGLPNELIIL